MSCFFCLVSLLDWNVELSASQRRDQTFFPFITWQSTTYLDSVALTINVSMRSKRPSVRIFNGPIPLAQDQQTEHPMGFCRVTPQPRGVPEHSSFISPTERMPWCTNSALGLTLASRFRGFRALHYRAHERGHQHIWWYLLSISSD